MTGLAPGGGSLRGKCSKTQSTTLTVRMIVPARRTNAQALFHTWESQSFAVGMRYEGSSR